MEPDFKMSLQEVESLRIDEAIKSVLEQVEVSSSTVKPKKTVIKKVKKQIMKKNKEHKLSYIRGKRIFELCQKYPILEEKASCRKPEMNSYRNKIWEEVTSQLNEELKTQDGFKPINVIQARKFDDYYKRRCQPDAPLEEDLLAPIGQDIVAPPLSQQANPIPSQKDIERRKLYSARLSFMIELTTRIMNETKLDQMNQERSIETNHRRIAMWKFITKMVNNKYKGRLGGLQIAQVKKSYSNYKRRHPEIIIINQSEDEIIDEIEMKMEDFIKEENEEDDDEDIEIDVEDSLIPIQKTETPSPKLENSNLFPISREFELGKDHSIGNAIIVQYETTI